MQLPWRPKEALLALKKQSDDPIHLTKDGLEQLTKKLADLKAAMPRLSEEVARTAAYGDRSENAEYKDAKRAQRGTQAQIFKIEDQLRRAVVITSQGGDTIQIGSTVTLETPDKAQKIFEIVGPAETNPSKGRISHESPLGKALLEKKLGETFQVKGPTRTQEYRILKIE